MILQADVTHLSCLSTAIWAEKNISLPHDSRPVTYPNTQVTYFIICLVWYFDKTYFDGIKRFLLKTTVTIV
jgi:hypothetical protein